MRRRKPLNAKAVTLVRLQWMKEAGIHDGSKLALEERRLQRIGNLEFQEARNFGRQKVQT